MKIQRIARNEKPSEELREYLVRYVDILSIAVRCDSPPPLKSDVTSNALKSDAIDVEHNDLGAQFRKED